MSKAALLTAALFTVACGGGGIAGPTVDLPKGRPIRVWVQAVPEIGAAALGEAIARVQEGIEPGEVVIQQGIAPAGERQIWVTWKPEDGMFHRGENVVAYAVPWACACVGEGTIVYGDAAAAGSVNSLVHEMLHLFGLPHNPDYKSVMHPWSPVPELMELDRERLKRAVEADSDAAGGMVR